MTATTKSTFNANTEALEVALEFADAIRGKTILVTGVNQGGLGFTTAEAFASQSPALIIIAGRNPGRVQQSIDALKVKFPGPAYRALKLDLGTQKGVRAAAAELFSWTDVLAIDIVVNNAAIMNIPERTINEDGLEIQFATNHMGHFLFTSLIMPKLIQAAKGKPKGSTRVINVTSLSPTSAGMRWSDINFEKVNTTLPKDEQPVYEIHKRWGIKDPESKSYLPLEGYNQSKVANVLFSVGLNERLYDKYGILSLSVHPGIIFTELSRYAAPETMAAIQDMLKAGAFTPKSLGAGSSTTLVAATDPGLAKPETRDGKENYGVYLIDCQFSDLILPRACSTEGAEMLWKLSEQLLKEDFAW